MTTQTNSAPFIEVRNAYKRFGDYLVVENLSMRIERGEIVALLGRTGAGKSTVMSMLMGTIGCDSGEVRVAGVDPSVDFQALRGKMAVAFQTDRLLPWRTAVENVELGLQILNRPKKETREAALKWLERVKLKGAENKYVHELSGGMRQRVSLARALAVDPELVFLDEVFSQLDHVTSQVLRKDFAQIVRDVGKTCVFVTHRIEDALDIADRVFVLAPPAQVCLEIRIDKNMRKDTGVLAQLHDQIERAIGGDESEHVSPMTQEL
ncbi:MAG TPA: ABC transporter ATP-binding protein [Noviherbaspirillum sp.]|nr:ABC transporter ATP-binding protein [Noviherbaspirillum sp.]